ncbi:17712_t:CDS:2, partial [Funneliformis caledonium]
CISPIELVNEELILASGEYHMVSKDKDFRKKDPLSDDTDKVQGLLQELSIPEEPEEENDSEETSLVEKRVMKANQNEILCWYQFIESFEKRVKEIMNSNSRFNDQQARTRVYEE